MIVYLAAPIDFAKDGLIEKYKAEVYSSFKESAWIYDPSSAWTAPEGLDPDGAVHQANLAVLRKANLVIAVLVRGTLTIGTVLEIQDAVDANIPVCVLGNIGQNSVALAELEVPVVASMNEFDGDWSDWHA